MLKRKDSPYVAGRVKGLWWKWKRDPHALDVVLMYAQRGHGKRVELLFRLHLRLLARRRAGGRELVPVGKAYFGFTDEELRQLDRWVRDHTTQRYGPVREVDAEARARGRVRQRAPLDPPQIRRGDALSRASPGSAGTSPPPRPTGWRRWSG